MSDNVSEVIATILPLLDKPKTKIYFITNKKVVLG